MNANELADYMQMKADTEMSPKFQRVATMLREQQDKIEKLERWKKTWYSYTKDIEESIFSLQEQIRKLEGEE